MEKRTSGGSRQRPSNSGTTVAHRGSLPADWTRVRFASKPVRGGARERFASALFLDSDQGEVRLCAVSGQRPGRGSPLRCFRTATRERFASALFPDSDQGEVRLCAVSGQRPGRGLPLRWFRTATRERFASALVPDSDLGEVCVRHSRESGLGRRVCLPAVIRPWSLETTVNTRRHHVPFTV